MRAVIFIKPSVPQYMPKLIFLNLTLLERYLSDNINEDPKLEIQLVVTIDFKATVLRLMLELTLENF